MYLHESLHLSPKIPLYSLIFTSIFSIAVSIIALLIGITIVFQNLFYFPIIIACAFYLRRGFFFSLLLITIYGILILIFAQTSAELISALVRVVIFILVGGVVTWLSSRYFEKTDELLESEKKFRDLFDANDAGIAIHEVIYDNTGQQADYRFLDVNPAYEEMTGQKAADIIGKSVRDLLPGSLEYWLGTYAEVAVPGKTAHFETYSREFERHYEVTAYASKPGRFVSLIRDITRRVEQEQRLKETHDYLDSLISHANVPIIIWDPNFHITRVNHAFELLTGRPAEYLVGRHLSILFPPDESDHSMQLIQSTQKGVRWETVEIPVIHQDGKLRTVVWNSATIYRSDDKTPVATIAQGRDVTAERFLEREKERAAIQIKENIAQLAILNDGIRNPLTIIAIYADMIGNEQISTHIQGEVRRIDEMVTTLDREWIYSSKILDYLRKNDQVSFDFVPTYTPPPRAVKPVVGEQVVSTPPVTSHERFVEEIQARLYSILDSVDAYIFVADIDTYEFLYQNKQARKLFGNVIGEKCHAVLFDNPQNPCSFCTNALILERKKPGETFRRECQHPKNHKWYDSRSSAVPWSDGRLVRLEIWTDITDRIESEEKFVTLFEKTQSPILVTDDTGQYIDANPAALAFLDITRDELVKKQVWDFTPLGLSDEQKQNYTSFTRKRTLETEYLVNGMIKTLLLNIVPLEHDGRVVMYGIGQDISDRKEMERQDKLGLTRLEAFLTLLGMVDSPEQDILDYTLEISLSVTDSEFAFVGFISQDEEEMIIHTWSKGAMEICQVTDTPIHFPISKAGIWGECIRNRAPFILNDYSKLHPAKHGCPDGHVPITRFMGVPVLDGERIVAIVAVANKTSDYSNEDASSLLTLGNLMWEMIHRERMRDELKRVSSYNRTLIETSLDPLVTIGRDGKITDVNAATELVTGYTRDDLIGTDFSDYFTDPEDAKNGYLTVFEKGIVYDYPLAIRHRDGTITQVLYNASLYLDEKGDIGGIFAAARDVTLRKEIENALFEQEERYRLALKATNDVIWDYDVINDSQRWNESGMVVFGWSDIVKAPQTAAWWTDKVHPDDRERVSEGFDAALADAGCLTWHDEYRFRRTDGRYAHVMDRGYILRDADGVAIRMIGAMLDITGWIEANEALIQSEERFRGLVNTITSGVATFSVLDNGTFGKDYIVTDMNRMALEIFGKTPDEVKGKSFADLNPDIDSYDLIPVFQQVWKTGKPEFFPLILYDDNRQVQYFDYRIYKLKNGEIVTVFADVTGEKSLEEALQRSRALLDQTQHLTKVGGWEYEVFTRTMTWTDETYRIHEIDPELIPAGSPEHIAWSLQCYDPEDRLVIEEAFNRCITEGVSYSLEFPFTSMKKNRIWIHTMARPVIDNGQVVRVFGNIIDISERKRIEDALRQANRQLNLLTSITRHDIINKTTAILNSLDIIQSDYPDPDLTHLIEIVSSATEDIKTHIEFTRTYQDLGSHEPQWFRLDMLMPSSLQPTIRLLSELRDYEIYADPMINLVFQNLLDNSVRHGQRVTCIRVTASQEGDSLCIRWEDDGVGISMDQKERIFERGFGKNTGLGLFLVREILEISGITIREAGVFGSGAMFEMVVPQGKFRA